MVTLGIFSSQRECQISAAKTGNFFRFKDNHTFWTSDNELKFNIIFIRNNLE